METPRVHKRLSRMAAFSLVLLAFFLAIPGLTGFVFDNKASLEKLENRYMAECPPANLLAEDPARFVKDFGKFLNDRIGFRRSANQLYRHMKYYVLHDPPLQNITIGESGCVFMNSHRLDQPNFVFDLLCRQQVDPNKQLVDRIDAIFSDVNALYAHNGADVTIAIAPTTVGLYADKLPDDVDKEYRDGCLAYENNDNLLFQLRKRSEQQGGYRLYYPFELFKAHRNEPFFYPKDRFHWAGRSTYLFARNLLWQLGITKDLKIDDPTEVNDVADDMKRFFGFRRPIKAINYPYKGLESNVTYPGWSRSVYQRGSVVHFTTENSFSKRTGLLLSNSFGEELARHLCKGFREFYFVDLNNIQKKEEHDFFLRIRELTKPDNIFVLFDDAGVLAVPKRLGAFHALVQEEQSAQHHVALSRAR